MWISIRSSRGPQSEQVLMSRGLQGLVHSLTFVVWLLQYPRWGRQRTVTPCRRIPWPRGLESFQLMHFSSTISNETIRDHCNAIMRNGNMFCFPYQGNFHLNVINAKQWNQMEPMKHFLLNPLPTNLRLTPTPLSPLINLPPPPDP